MEGIEDHAFAAGEVGKTGETSSGNRLQGSWV